MLPLHHVTALVLSALLAAPAVASAATSRLSVLDGFGHVRALNDRGLVVGLSPTGKPVAWERGATTVLPAPTVAPYTSSGPAVSVDVVDVNESGVIAGNMGSLVHAPRAGCPTFGGSSGVGYRWTRTAAGSYTHDAWGTIDADYPSSQAFGVQDSGAITGLAWSRGGSPCHVSAFITSGATPTAETEVTVLDTLLAVASNGLILQRVHEQTGCGDGKINARGTYFCGLNDGLHTVISRRGTRTPPPAKYYPTAIGDDDRIGGVLVVPGTTLFPKDDPPESINRATALLPNGTLVDLNARIRAGAPAAYKTWVFEAVEAMNGHNGYGLRGCSPETYIGDDGTCKEFYYDGAVRLTGTVTEPGVPADPRGLAATATRPAVGVRLRVKLPGGAVKTVTTDRTGRYVLAVPTAGAVAVSLVGRTGCAKPGACKASASLATLIGDLPLASRVDATTAIAVPVPARTSTVRTSKVAVPVACRLVTKACAVTVVVRRASTGAVVGRSTHAVAATARAIIAVTVGAVRGAVEVTATVKVGTRSIATTRTTTLV